MIERIERIARVKPVDDDVGRRFDSRNHRDDKDNSFLNELRQAMNKKNAPKTSEIPAAYNLELTSIGTQSLFYSGGLSLEALLR